MKFMFTTLSMILFSFLAQSQVTQSAGSFQDFAQIDEQSSANELIGGKKMNFNRIDGSPYMTKEFQKGEIVDHSKDRTITAYVRYRILDDMFEVKKTPRSQSSMTIKRGNNFTISTDNKKFVFLENLPVKINGTNSGYAVEMISDENGASLYKRMSQTFNEGRKQQRSAYGKNNGRQDPSIETSTDYFVKINGKLSLLKASKRRAANAFPDHKKQLENYIDNKNLRFRGDKTDMSLARLVNYYNSL